MELGRVRDLQNSVERVLTRYGTLIDTTNAVEYPIRYYKRISSPYDEATMSDPTKEYTEPGSIAAFVTVKPSEEEMEANGLNYIDNCILVYASYNEIIKNETLAIEAGHNFLFDKLEFRGIFYTVQEFRPILYVLEPVMYILSCTEMNIPTKNAVAVEEVMGEDDPVEVAPEDVPDYIKESLQN